MSSLLMVDVLLVLRNTQYFGSLFMLLVLHIIFAHVDTVCTGQYSVLIWQIDTVYRGGAQEGIERALVLSDTLMRLVSSVTSSIISFSSYLSSFVLYTSEMMELLHE